MYDLAALVNHGDSIPGPLKITLLYTGSYLGILRDKYRVLSKLLLGVVSPREIFLEVRVNVRRPNQETKE
jgi:hypothetical protein